MSFNIFKKKSKKKIVDKSAMSKKSASPSFLKNKASELKEAMKQKESPPQKGTMGGAFNEWIKKSKDSPEKTFLVVFYTKIDNSRKPLCLEYLNGGVWIDKIFFAVDSGALFFMDHKLKNKKKRIEGFRIPVADCFAGETFAKSPRLEYNKIFCEQNQMTIFHALKNKIMNVSAKNTQDVKDFIKQWGIYIGIGIFAIILINNYFG